MNEDDSTITAHKLLQGLLSDKRSELQQSGNIGNIGILMVSSNSLSLTKTASHCSPVEILDTSENETVTNTSISDTENVDVINTDAQCSWFSHQSSNIIYE